MEIVYKKIGELKPYENNPRKNDEAVDAVAASISEFGWKVPVVIDTNNVIVAGHTRYKAAKKLGIENIPCIVADDLTEEQVRAYRLADNKVSELAGWDFDMLTEELSGLDFSKIDMEQFGFNFSGWGNPIPDNLDAVEDYNSSAPIAGKFTFSNYSEYAQHEHELKDFADKIGAEFSVVKT